MIKINNRTKKILKQIYNVFLVLLGTFVVAFGASVFLLPFGIVSGGLSGFSLIIAEFIPLDIDIIVMIFTWGLYIIGLIFLGWKFSLKTLISSIFYPLFVSLVLRSGMGEYLVSLLINNGVEINSSSSVLELINLENLEAGRMIICGLIGGAFTGLGCGITFIGGGSTGGFDILTFILNKYTGLKTSISAFLLDSSVVIVGLIINAVKYSSIGFIAGLIGVFAAVLCAMMIEFIYDRQSGAYFADIITTKSNEIKERVINELDRSVTIYKVTGGYSNEEKICVRIIFSRDELLKVKDMIAEIDKDAFMTIGECQTVNGEGFSPLHSSKENTISKLKKIGKKNKTKDE